MKTNHRRLTTASTLLALALTGLSPQAAGKKPLKVFILAGQSNMQGHAALRTLEYLIYNEETAQEYQHWKDRWGLWRQRNDVWVWTTDGERYGNLKPGFGASPREMGPELGFGWVVGKALEEQVLLIKTCWGGRSVKRDFRPPSAGLPPEEQLRKELEAARRRNPETTLEDIKARYGKAYRDMLAAVRKVLDNLKDYFPDYAPKRGYEIAGFVFFQGWNDMVDHQQRAEKYASYTKRLAQLIRDVRKDLKAPKLPFVIAAMGQNGSKPAKGGQLEVRNAPMAMNGVPEFKGHRLTAFYPAFEYMLKNNIRTKNVVYLTDLYPTYPDNAYEVHTRKIPVLYHQLGIRKLLWLVPSMVKGTNYWRPPVGKIIWIEPIL